VVLGHPVQQLALAHLRQSLVKIISTSRERRKICFWERQCQRALRGRVVQRAHVAVAIDIEFAPLRRFGRIVAQQLLHLQFGAKCYNKSLDDEAAFVERGADATKQLALLARVTRHLLLHFLHGPQPRRALRHHITASLQAFNTAGKNEGRGAKLARELQRRRRLGRSGFCGGMRTVSQTEKQKNAGSAINKECRSAGRRRGIGTVSLKAAADAYHRETRPAPVRAEQEFLSALGRESDRRACKDTHDAGAARLHKKIKNTTTTCAARMHTQYHTTTASCHEYIANKMALELATWDGA
jgi:hypothetical protein